MYESVHEDDIWFDAAIDKLKRVTKDYTDADYDGRSDDDFMRAMHDDSVEQKKLDEFKNKRIRDKFQNFEEHKMSQIIKDRFQNDSSGEEPDFDEMLNKLEDGTYERMSDVFSPDIEDGEESGTDTISGEEEEDEG